ncbi:MAG: CDP-alcohol phosphatidyltransferase family protein [Vicinamibacterales bacterium]
MRRRLPNLLTSLRIAAIPVLAALAFSNEREMFGALLIACLVGDVVDGALARALGAESALGALLDSVADTLLFFMTIAGILVFFSGVVREHAIAFAAVPVAWLAENVAALVRYRRLSSFHTYMSRAAAVAMGIFVAVLFLWGMRDTLFYSAVGLALAASAEEFVLLVLLPAWTPDVRGVYWVVRDQQGRSR